MIETALAALLLLCSPSDARAMAPHVAAQAQRWGVPPVILAAVARKETACRAGLVSRRGAVGRWQILPGGLAALPMSQLPPEKLATDEINVNLAARHLAKWHRICDGNWASALGIYNGSAKKCSDPPTKYARDVLQWVDQAKRGVRS